MGSSNFPAHTRRSRRAFFWSSAPRHWAILQRALRQALSDGPLPIRFDGQVFGSERFRQAASGDQKESDVKCPSFTHLTDHLATALERTNVCGKPAYDSARFICNAETCKGSPYARVTRSAHKEGRADIVLRDCSEPGFRSRVVVLIGALHAFIECIALRELVQQVRHEPREALSLPYTAQRDLGILFK